MKILNTIKPVTRAFTAMDAARLVVVIVVPHGVFETWACTNVIAPINASQVARGDKLKIGLNIMKIDCSDGPKYAIAKIEGMITTRIF